MPISILALLRQRIVLGLCLLLGAVLASLGTATATGSQGTELGLTLRSDGARHGYLVTAVSLGSVGEIAGLRAGDVLVDASFGAAPLTLCPDEPGGPANLRAALSKPAAHIGRLRPNAPQHEQYQRVDIARAVAEVARRQRAEERAQQRAQRREQQAGQPARGGARATEPNPSAPASAAPRTIELVPATVTDPELGGLASHTLLVPKGWRIGGAPVWNLGTATNLVTLDVTLDGTAGEQVRFFPSATYTYSDNAQVRQQTEGMPGALFVPPPDSITQHVVRDILPRLRPTAGDVRVVSTKPVPEVRQRFEEIYAGVLQQAREMDAQWRRQGSGRASAALDAGLVRVTYVEGGQAYEEEVFTAFMRSDYILSSGGLMPDIWTSSWQRIAGSSARAPAASLDVVLPTALAVSQSLRQTPQWSAILHDLHMQISRARHEATMADLRRQREAIASRTESLSDIQFEGWKKRQAIEDRMQHSFVNSIHGVDDYVRGDGTNVALPDGYASIYYSPTKGYLLTNDSLLQPNVDLETKDWEPVRRAER